MIVVSVMGVPDGIGQEKLSKIEGSLKLAIPFVENVKISHSRILVFFLKDKLEERPEITIIAKVDGLPKSQFESAGKKLAETIRNILFSNLENASRVECFVNQFDEKHGFASISRS